MATPLIVAAVEGCATQWGGPRWRCKKKRQRGRGGEERLQVLLGLGDNVAPSRRPKAAIPSFSSVSRVKKHVGLSPHPLKIRYTPIHSIYSRLECQPRLPYCVIHTSRLVRRAKNRSLGKIALAKSRTINTILEPIDTTTTVLVLSYHRSRTAPRVKPFQRRSAPIKLRPPTERLHMMGQPRVCARVSVSNKLFLRCAR